MAGRKGTTEVQIGRMLERAVFEEPMCSDVENRKGHESNLRVEGKMTEP